MIYNVNGTATPIATALLVADKIKGQNKNDEAQNEFIAGIKNSEYGQ